MARYEWLDRWAARDQANFEQHRASAEAHQPGSEPAWQRGLIAFFNVVSWATKPFVVVALIGLPIGIAHDQGVLAAAVVTPVLAAVVGLVVFVTVERVRIRRRDGLNWFTGLAPRNRVTSSSENAEDPRIDAPRN